MKKCIGPAMVISTALLALSGCTTEQAGATSTKATEAAIPAQQASSKQASAPNILFIMSDDHAERAISAYGHDLIQTPNIDRIAAGGMLFENAFVTNSICGPSRAVMLTGKHSHLNGFKNNYNTFDNTQVTFPKILRKAGYQTAVIGKWHLKSAPTGFDTWAVLPGQGDYYSPTFKTANGNVTYKGQYVTDQITNMALDFLQQRDKSKPFALLYHHKAPHRNWMPDTKHLANKSLRKKFPVPANFFDDYHTRPNAAVQDMQISDMTLSHDMKLQKGTFEKETGTGGFGDAKNFDKERFVDLWIKELGRMTPEQRAIWDEYYQDISDEYHAVKDDAKALALWQYQRYMHDYMGSIKSLDENIGRVLDYLQAQGLSDNTIVVYTSDQGFYLGEHGWYDKRFMYEESMSTPLIIKYPNGVKAGVVNTSLVQNLDFAQTFLDYAGLVAPSDMQGKSLKPLLEGNTPDDWRDGLYYEYFQYPGTHNVGLHYGVRTDRYKLIHFTGDLESWELFDLEKDPSEMTNVYANVQYKDIQADLHKRLEDLRLQYKAN